MAKGVAVDGQRIRMLREEECYSRSELAELCGVDPHTLYRIERGMMNTSARTLRKIALALNVAPKTLKRPQNSLRAS